MNLGDFMYIIARNAHYYQTMLDIFELEFETELNEVLSDMIKEGIRLIHYKVPMEAYKTNTIGILNGLIFTVVDQCGVIGKDKLITNRDFLQFLGTTKPTVNKWSKWLLEAVPEIYNLRAEIVLEADELYEQDRTGQMGSTTKKAESTGAFSQTPDLWYDWASREYLFGEREKATLFYLNEKWQEALKICETLLKESPSDGLGIRYMALPLAVLTQNGTLAKKLIEDYEEDNYAAHMNRALFELGSNQVLAYGSIKKAHEHNPYGLRVLLASDPREEYEHLPENYEFGSLEEAEIYAFETGLVWRQINEAWLFVMENVRKLAD